MKSYTDISQSEVLAKILPLESADWTILNCFNEFGEKDGSNIRVVKEVNTLNDSVEKIPCWSLAALLDILPDRTCIFKKTYKDGRMKYQGVMEGNKELILKDNTIDAAFEMVCFLLINKLI